MAYERGARVEIDLASVRRNVSALRALTPKGTRFMAVVKADGYGHGALAVSAAALQAGADCLGVATIEELLALREAGVRHPIHPLAEPPASAAQIVVEQSAVPALYSRDFASALAKAATDAGTVADYHLKIDTGMNRVGVRAEDAVETALWLRGLGGIRMTGVFTHFATADVPGDWEFERQVERFEATLTRLRGEGLSLGTVHAANSAATILHPATHYGMVRCGIAVYGLHPAASTVGRLELVAAMSVKARVASVRRIGMGEGVSYGFTYHASAPTTIATLPLGYADGIHRAASKIGRAHV